MALQLQHHRPLIAVLALVAGGSVALTGCQTWPLGRGPHKTGQPPTTQQALLEKQLEQKAAAQALLLIKAQTRQQALVAGHQATVQCLRSERGQTDGSELRCEDWTYVRENYPVPAGPRP